MLSTLLMYKFRSLLQLIYADQQASSKRRNLVASDLSSFPWWNWGNSCKHALLLPCQDDLHYRRR